MHPSALASYNNNPETFVTREANLIPTNYENRHKDTTPHKNQVELIEDLHSPEAETEYIQYLRQLLELVAGLGDIPQTCDGCGQQLETGQKANRKTEILHTDGKHKSTKSFCLGCAKITVTTPAPVRTTKERAQIMWLEGLTQKEIGIELGGLSQQQVSNLLKT
jgi:hypothetical protein